MKLTIANKLYFGFGFVAMIILILVVFNFSNLNKLKTLEDISAQRAADAVLVQEAAGMSAQAYGVIADAIINRDLALNAREWEEVYSEMVSDMEAIGKLVDTPEELKWAAAAKEMVNEYNEDYQTVVRLVQADDMKRIKETDAEIDAMKVEFERLLGKISTSLTAEMVEASEEFDREAGQAKTISTILAIVALSASVLLAVFITRSIVSGIKRITDRLKDIAQGEGDLRVRLNITSSDEIGELSKWFDVFVEKIHTVISNVKASAKQVATAGGEISAASEEMAAGAEEQQAQLSEVATSIEEMSAMILETSNNAAQTQNNAKEANMAAVKGSGTVNQTIAGIEGIASIVESAALQIGALKTRSQEIADVIQVIDDISDPTNLLALNANIEAARAGDAGRGFAVVADEVRKLAERTVGATADIEAKIKQIQNDVNSSVEAMEKITEQSKSGQKLAGEAGAALGEISGSIDQVNAAISQIASAAIEQSAGVEEISKNVESVSTVSKQSASGAQELAASSEQLNREVQSLDKLMDQFKV